MSKVAIAQAKAACEMVEPPSAKDANKSLEVLNAEAQELEATIAANVAEILGA